MKIRLIIWAIVAHVIGITSTKGPLSLQPLVKHVLVIMLVLFGTSLFAQTDNTSDQAQDSSLLNFLRRFATTEERDTITTITKADSLTLAKLIASVPRSSKNDLIENWNRNRKNILIAKNYFDKLIPAGFDVYIEFTPPDEILHRGEGVDFWAYAKQPFPTLVPSYSRWFLELSSPKFDSIFGQTQLPLNKAELIKLQYYLKQANCISVHSGKETEIGFARSGLGKYSYLIFDHPLTQKERQTYNDNCNYIFYKDNVVFKYGGGAVGPQCFPD